MDMAVPGYQACLQTKHSVCVKRTWKVGKRMSSSFAAASTCLLSPVLGATALPAAGLEGLTGAAPGMNTCCLGPVGMSESTSVSIVCIMARILRRSSVASVEDLQTSTD